VTRKEVYDLYYSELLDACESKDCRTALGRSIAAFRSNFKSAMERFPYTKAMAAEVRALKERCLADWPAMLDTAMKNVRANHAEAYFARTREELETTLKQIIGTGQTIVKAKSLTGEEVQVREYLEGIGNHVWETDLGELIVQLMHGTPMHILSPAINVSREKVAEVFTKAMGRPIKPDISEEVEAARQFLRQKYVDADVGMSSTNVFAADSGAAFVIENEGNIRLATGFPRKHVIVAGIEKLVPTIGDAFKVAEVTWRYAQYAIPSYVNIIAAPSKTGDIEKVTTYGAHGPKELHVVFYDGGRSEMLKHPIYRQAAYCLRCGGCMYECPVYTFTAGRFGYRYFIGYGAAWTAYVAGGWDRAAPIAYTCLRCGRCVEQCPVKIDTVQIISELRKDLMK
jgi:L-lactate dehydrogenase complex protein LldG